MTRYARLLYNHFMRIEQVNSAFDTVAPMLEALCSKEGILYTADKVTDISGYGQRRATTLQIFRLFGSLVIS